MTETDDETRNGLETRKLKIHVLCKLMFSFLMCSELFSVFFELLVLFGFFVLIFY